MHSQGLCSAAHCCSGVAFVVVAGRQARFDVALCQSICDERVARGIAISLPGYGWTDMKPGRKVLDRANEDLLASSC